MLTIIFNHIFCGIIIKTINIRVMIINHVIMIRHRYYRFFLQYNYDYDTQKALTIDVYIIVLET